MEQWSIYVAPVLIVAISWIGRITHDRALKTLDPDERDRLKLAFSGHRPIAAAPGVIVALPLGLIWLTGPVNADRLLALYIPALCILLVVYVLWVFRTLVMLDLNPEYRWSYLISRTLLIIALVVVVLMF